MSLQDRIDEEVKNIRFLPDPLTPEQRKHFGELIDMGKKEEAMEYAKECKKLNN